MKQLRSLEPLMLEDRFECISWCLSFVLQLGQVARGVMGCLNRRFFLLSFRQKKIGQTQLDRDGLLGACGIDRMSSLGSFFVPVNKLNTLRQLLATLPYHIQSMFCYLLFAKAIPPRHSTSFSFSCEGGAFLTGIDQTTCISNRFHPQLSKYDMTQEQPQYQQQQQPQYRTCIISRLLRE